MTRARPSTSPTRRPARVVTRRGGFALVIVLWVLAGLTVVAVAVASSARASSEALRALRDRVHAESAFLSTSSRLKMLMVTGLTGSTSIDGERGRLYADGRASRVGADEWVTVQDVNGLLNLNRFDNDRMAGLLVQCGAEPSTVDALRDALTDYADTDQLKRVNGAEAFEYRAAGLREPRNADLLSREELWRVKGWEAIHPAWRAADCDRWVTVRNDGTFNLNTAPAALMRASGLSPEAVVAAVEARRDGINLSQTGFLSGVSSGGGFAVGGLVGRTLRVTHESAWVEWALAYELESTTTSDGGPWRMHEIRYPARAASAPSAGASLPPPVPDTAERTRSPQDAATDPPFAIGR